MPRSADLDRGDPVIDAGKRAEMMDAAEKLDREADRAGLRDLDRRIEQSPGLSRFRRDQSRILPRDATADAVRRRRLPPDERPRRLTVYRQRILNKQKTALDRRRVPVRAKRAFSEVFGGDGTQLREINNQLSDHVGDVDQLDDTTKTSVQRVDRIIALAEAENTADNIVYVPLRLPAAINPGNVKGWLGNNFKVGTEVNFDRYTIGSHEMVQAGGRQPHWRPVLEIVTRRGAYVGRSPGSNETSPDASHILPRGMRLRCVGITTVGMTARDGMVSQRLVLQMEDY